MEYQNGPDQNGSLSNRDACNIPGHPGYVSTFAAPGTGPLNDPDMMEKNQVLLENIRQRVEHIRGDNNEREKQIFCGGLDPETTREEFPEWFEQWGDVSKAELKIGKGFGFITYYEAKSVDAAIEHKEDCYIHGKRVEIKRVEKRAPGGRALQMIRQHQEQQFTIFVGGMNPHVTQEELTEHFEKFGEVVRSDLRDGRGYGFITYANQQGVDAAFANRENHVLSGKWVDIRLAEARRKMGGGLTHEDVRAKGKGEGKGGDGGGEGKGEKLKMGGELKMDANLLQQIQTQQIRKFVFEKFENL